MLTKFLKVAFPIAVLAKSKKPLGTGVYLPKLNHGDADCSGDQIYTPDNLKGWFWYHGSYDTKDSYYFMPAGQYDWDTFKDFCENTMNAKVWCPESQQEVLDVMTTHPSRSASGQMSRGGWTGLQKINNQWTCDGKAQNFLWWGPNQPDEKPIFGNRPVDRVYAHYSLAKFYDTHDDTRGAMVCEINRGMMCQQQILTKVIRTSVPEGLRDMLNVVASPTISMQVSAHGCQCARLSNQDYAGGIVSVDGIDVSCKKWFQQRKCNGLEGGSCYLNTDDNKGSLTIPEMYEVSLVNGEWTCDLLEEGCVKDTCLIDLEYANQVSGQVVNGQQVQGDANTCPNNDHGGNGPIGCQGDAPFLEFEF